MDLARIWTIGWGHTQGVKEGDKWSQAQADQQLMQDIAEMERIVLSCIFMQLNDNQVSALVSFTFNVGLGYKGIKDGLISLVCGRQSSLLKYIRQGNFEMAALEFPKWDKVDGLPSRGILRRRLAEQALFVKKP